MLIAAYEAVAASARLGVLKGRSTFGDATELEKAGACPRMIWLQTQDTFGPPDTLARVPTIVDGRRVIATSRFLRWAGCQIHLFTDYGPAGQREMESLLNELHMALYDVLGGAGVNYNVEPAAWYPRAALSQKTICVVQPIRVAVPIWDTQPAQLLGAVKTSFPST